MQLTPKEYALAVIISGAMFLLGVVVGSKVTKPLVDSRSYMAVQSAYYEGLLVANKSGEGDN